MPIAQRIAPCLWFDSQAEDAANFYCSIFRNSRITSISRYGEAGKENHRQPPGSVMLVAFELEGQPFTALNGGPVFEFNEAVSLQIYCDTQKEIDYYWQKLTADGGEENVCGWLKDKYGLSWQVVPRVIEELFEDHRSEQYARAMDAMMKMKKLDIDELKRAYG